MRSIVRFESEQHYFEGFGDRPVIRVVVDGRDLAELVRDVEAPYAQADGHPDLAGRYVGLDLRELRSSVQEHFTGAEGSDLACGPVGKTVLLGCTCGVAGCWPLMARIEVRDDDILWSDFEQPHRRDTWSYADFGPITFTRAQYEQTLGALSSPPG